MSRRNGNSGDRQSGQRAEFDLTLLSDVTNHPYRVQCEQHKLTRILYAQLKDMDNVEVIFGTRVTGVSQTADEVVAIAERDGEEVRYTGAYLIGADGASSAVRIDLDIGFEGVTYPELFIQASTPFEFREHIPNMSLINYISDADEWFVLLRVPDLWRALFPTREGESEEEAISEDGLQRRLNGVVARDVPTTSFTARSTTSTSASRRPIGRDAFSSPAIRRTSTTRWAAWA